MDHARAVGRGEREDEHVRARHLLLLRCPELGQGPQGFPPRVRQVGGAATTASGPLGTTPQRRHRNSARRTAHARHVTLRA